MNPSSLLIEQIHFLEQSIFKEFALETSNNIHLKSVDLNNPLTSIYKIILCDIVTSQMYSTSVELPKIIPKSIYVKDNNSQKCSYIKFNNDGILYLEELYDNLIAQRQTLNDKKYKEKEVSTIDDFRETVLGGYSLFYCKKWLEKYELNDVATNQTLDNEFVCPESIKFKNGEYPDIRPDEVVNYTIEIKHKTYPDHKSIKNEIVTAYFTKISSLALHVKRNKKNYLEIENQSVRAAISQVMARNTSHNIGAHVMNKLIGNLRGLGLLLFEKEKSNYQYITGLKELHKETVKSLEDKDWYIKATDDNFKVGALKNEIILEQISIFNNYVKCRMDYLADISFGTPLMQTNKYAYADLFKELDKVRLLLEHISGLGENFKYEIQFTYNGKPMNGETDLSIAIPNDILGMQAFYNILENIIRNTAKHAKQKPLTTTFTVDFIDKLENAKLEQQNVLSDYIVVEVYDNVPVKGGGRDLTNEEKREYERVMGPNNNKDSFISEIDSLVFSQNSRINSDILKDNQLRSGALGIIEMDASAAYLRKRDAGHINHDNYTVRYDDSWSACSVAAKKDETMRGTDCRHFSKAFKKAISEGENFALSYRFFLLRPAMALIITNLYINADKAKELKKQGILIEKPADFEKHLKDGKVYNHEFVLIDENIELPKVKIKIEPQRNIKTEIDLTTYYKTSLPLRILEIETTDLNKLLDRIADDDKKKWLQTFEEFCWNKWERELINLYPCKKHHSNHCVNFSVKNDFNKFSCHSIVLLDHLYNDANEIIQNTDEWDKHKSKDYYVEALSSLAQSKMPDFDVLANLKSSTAISEKFKYYLGQLNEPSKYKIAEAALSRIIVIDERVQQAAKNVFSHVTYAELYQRANILLPKLPNDKNINTNNSIDLSASNFDVLSAKKLKKYVLGSISNSTKTDFILIHYSILERIYNDKKKINKVLDKISQYINVVVTSGRGVPDELSLNVRFVNLSSVISAFIEIRSKYLMYVLLSSSRKSKK